jgi:hypothetical protein
MAPIHERRTFGSSVAILALAAACAETHYITVNRDGTFSPTWTHAQDGDLVVWNLSARTDAIIPVTWSGNWPAPCSTPEAWNAAANMAGPLPRAETGVFALSPCRLTTTPAPSGWCRSPTPARPGRREGT